MSETEPTGSPYPAGPTIYINGAPYLPSESDEEDGEGFYDPNEPLPETYPPTLTDEGMREAYEQGDEALRERYLTDPEELVLPDVRIFTSENLESMGLKSWDVEEHFTADVDPLDVLSPPPEGALSYAPRNDYKTPERYYSHEEVARAISAPEMRSWLIRTKARRGMLNQPAQDQVKLALGAVVAVHGNTEGPAKDNLARLLSIAARSYNKQNHNEIAAGSLRALSPHSSGDREKLKAVAVRYVRDEMTNYHTLIRAFQNKPAVTATTQILRIKTASTIRKTFPLLDKAIQYVFFDPRGW